MRPLRYISFLFLIFFALCCSKDDLSYVQVGHWDVKTINELYDNGILYLSDTSLYELILNANKTGRKVEFGEFQRISSWDILPNQNQITLDIEIDLPSGNIKSSNFKYDILINNTDVQSWQRKLNTFLPSVGKTLQQIETLYLVRK
jgi:hypothetical protein